MVWLIVFQGAANLTFLVALLLVTREVHRLRMASKRAVASEATRSLIQEELQHYRLEIEQQLRKLIAIGDKANQILNRRTDGSYSLSAEEIDLQTTLHDGLEGAVQTVEDIEQAVPKDPDVAIDLRTLLRGQLA